MKILIADDEHLICEWLEYCFHDLPDYELVGIAHNGEEALKLYNQHKPDIVLTDIKMPIMDGLELLKRIKAINRNTFVVLLTAYSEFDYARQAVREGADEYLLKNEINKDSVVTFFTQVAKDFMNEEPLQPTTMLPKHARIKHILTKRDCLSQEDVSTLMNHGFQDYRTYVCISFWMSDLVALTTQIGSYFTDTIKAIYELETNRYVYTFILTLDDQQSELEKIKAVRDIMTHVANENTLRVGVSGLSNRPADLNMKIYESLYTLAPTFYRSEYPIRYAPTTMNLTAIVQNEDQFGLTLLAQYQALLTIRAKDKGQTITRIFALIEFEKYTNVRKIKEISSDIVEHLYTEYANHQSDYSIEDYKDIKRRIHQAAYFDDVVALVLKYHETFSTQNQIDRNDLSLAIKKAVAYIEQHYQESISLEVVAQEVGLNPEYLSRSFRKEVGKTYSSFLTELRLNQAHRLLVETNSQVQEIANAVGYYNVSYFSTLFKKEYGENPFDYRKKYHR